MLREKRAMAPAPMPKPMPKPAPKPAPAGGGAKPGAGGQAPAGGGGGGGITDMLGGGGMPGMPGGNPLDQVKGMVSTESGGLIKQHEDKIAELKQQIAQKKQELNQVEQQISGAKRQLDQTEQQLDQAKQLQDQGQPQDIAGLENSKAQIEEQIEQLETAKSAIEEEISKLNKEISVEADAISGLKSDRWTELKLKAVGFIPEAGMAVEMAGEQAMHAKHQIIEGRVASKEGKLEGAEGEAQQKAEAAGAAAKSAGAAAVASKPSSTPSAGGAAGGAGGGGGRIGGGLPHVGGFGGGGSGGGAGGGKPPIITGLLVGLSVLGGGLVVKSSGSFDMTTLLPVVLPIVLFIAALICIRLRTTHWLFLVIGIVLLIGSLYGIATRTAPHALAAYQSGAIGEAGEETKIASKKGVSGVIEDFSISWQRQMAMATGQNIEGDVDQQVKEDVGLEILPPYLPNPTKLNLDEARTLEIGARVKGFDPKTPITATTVCHMQTRDQAYSWTGGTRKVNLNPGDLQRLRPETIEGHAFDRDITCYPRVSECGHYIVTISSQADHLRTDAQMQNYIIDKEILRQRLRSYAESKDTELRSEGQVNSAINEIYKGQVGNFKSVSQKGAIKVVMATQPLALIGVSNRPPDDVTELTFRMGVENMMNGWIRTLNRVEVTIPGYFRPVQEFCASWQLEGNKLILKNDYLSTVNLYDTTRGMQKIFPSCHLVPSGEYALTEPTEATFLALVDYNYIVQSEYPTEIRTAQGEICRESGSTGGGAGGSGGSSSAAPGSAGNRTVNNSSDLTTSLGGNTS